MLFATPWYLLGALGAAIPVLIHLYGRRRARRVPFPSLMLIRAAQRERTSLVRLRQLWLMILRALAILLLSLGLAHPTVPWIRTAADPDRLAVIVVDDSLSMRTRVGQARFEVARGAATELLQRLPEGQSTALLAATAPEDAKYGTPRELLKPLAALRPSWQAVDLPHVLATLRQLGEARTTTYLFTDLQASNWSSSAPTAVDDHVTVVDCGQNLANRAVSALQVSEPPALTGRPVTLAAQVRQWGKPSASEVRVRLGQGALPPQTVAASERSEALFDWQPEKPGQVPASATASSDALREDDVAWQAIEVREQLRVAMVGPREQSQSVSLALSPDATARVQVAEALPSAQSDVAVVWELAQAATLRRFVEQGGGVLVFGVGMTQAEVDALLGVGQLTCPPARVLPAPTHIASFDVFTSPLRAFGNPAAGDLQEPEFRRYRDLALPTQSSLRILASFADGTPALLAGPLGQGRVVLANFGTGADDGDLQRQPVFVPLIHRLVGYLARRQWPELEEITAGEQVVISPATGAEAPGCTGPDGEAVAVLVDKSGWRLRPEQPGRYRLQWSQAAGAKGARLFAVNTDPLESDPRRLSAEELRQRLQPASVDLIKPEDAAHAVRRAPLALATPLLLLAFLLLLAETALSLAGRTRDDGERHEQS